jgi:hypothetical protein
LSVHNLKTTEMNQPLLVIKQKKVNIQSVMWHWQHFFAQRAPQGREPLEEIIYLMPEHCTMTGMYE